LLQPNVRDISTEVSDCNALLLHGPTKRASFREAMIEYRKSRAPRIGGQREGSSD
jgi:hypothetical protein